MGSLLVGMEFQHILRLLNTNVDGKEKIMYALTSIKGIGRRFSNICCKKAEVDMNKRAGEPPFFYRPFRGPPPIRGGGCPAAALSLHIAGLGQGHAASSL